ncbi:MAG: sensor histidine kinase [Candidatus Thorarchaeota archaeon]
MTTHEGHDGNWKKVLSILIEPHPSILGERKRQQHRILSSLLLLFLPIIVATAYTSDLIINTALVFPSVFILVFFVYILTRTRYADIALIIAIGGFTILPLLIWFFGSSWTPDDIPRLMVWIFVATTAGALLSRPVIVLIQGLIIILTMFIVIGVIFQVPFDLYDSHIGTAIVITTFVLITSIMLDSYITQLNQRSKDLTEKQNELEVYTQILRHDIRNDLQAILGSIELAELMLELNTRETHELLLQTMRIGERMTRLLNVFTMPMHVVGIDLVQSLEKVAEDAQDTFSNLAIEITKSDEVDQIPFTASRLLPMVWMNIFRNAARHAGKHPQVKVDIQVVKSEFHIQISDNGPGIHESEKEWLFKRGSADLSKESGLGLYLSRVVLESHGGSIELVENQQKEGTTLLIHLPISIP